MGFFADRRRHKEEAERVVALQKWKADDDVLRGFLADLDATSGGENVEGLLLKKDERAVLDYTGAALVEPRRQPGQYVGGYSGFSFKVVKGVRYHVGGSRGTYTPGPDVATAIDTGTVTITNQRVVFRGNKQTREWAFNKLVGWTHDDPHPITYLQVSNRQKTSGFAYQPEHAAIVHFRLAFALALSGGRVDDLRKQLQQELTEHQTARPAEITTTASS